MGKYCVIQLGVFILVLAGMVQAAAAAWAQETIKLADERLVKPQEQAEFHFDLEEIPAGKQIRLCLDGRIEWDSLGGSTGALLMYDGSIRFSVDKRAFSVRLRTSLPKGEWSGGGPSEGTWNTLESGGTFVARWTEADYTVERRVTLHPDRISVADTIGNTSSALIGVILENRLQLPEKPKRTLLARSPVKYLKQRSSPAHPTAMAELEGVTVCLVAEDDIFRIHAKISVDDDDVLVLSDPQLGIAPDKEHKLEWSIYSVSNGDYWDMINAIRRNWGVNVTLRGPSKWVHPSGVPTNVDQVEPWLQTASMVVLCNPIFGTEQERKMGVTIQHGTALKLCHAWCVGRTDRSLLKTAPGSRLWLLCERRRTPGRGNQV